MVLGKKSTRALSLLIMSGMLVYVAKEVMWKTDSSDQTYPDTLKTQIKSLRDLEGRHSDFIMPKCRDSGNNKSQSTNKKYGFFGPYDYLPNYKNPCWLPKGSDRVQCVPYFYIVGAPKAGTSDLFSRLTVHPEIQTGANKESRWFDWGRYEYPKQAGADAFISLFTEPSEVIQSHVLVNTSFHPLILMDGDPHYFHRNDYWRKVPENEGCQEPRVTIISQLHHLWPKTKLLLILRNPTARLYSAFLYMGVGPYTRENFHQKVVATMDKWKDCLKTHPFRFCLYENDIRKDGLGAMTAGIYSRYVLDILKVFPRDQLFIIRMEDIANSNYTLSILDDIFNFLDVQPLPEHLIHRILAKRVSNKGKNYETAGYMLEKTRKVLNDFYEPFNKELAYIFNDKRFLWLDKPVKVAKEKQ